MIKLEYKYIIKYYLNVKISFIKVVNYSKHIQQNKQASDGCL